MLKIETKNWDDMEWEPIPSTYSCFRDILEYDPACAKRVIDDAAHLAAFFWEESSINGINLDDSSRLRDLLWPDVHQRLIEMIRKISKSKVARLFPGEKL